MLVTALFLVFISAILHVSWNVLLQSESDPLDFATKAVTVGTLLLTPFILIYWWSLGFPSIQTMALFMGLLSGICELCYFFFLSYSYRHGELSIVYPIARGSAPVLSVLLGIFLLHEQIDQTQIIGVVLLIVGIWLVRRAKINGVRGLIPAFLTGVFIALYTVIDKVGLFYASPILFGEIKFLFTTIFLLLFLLVRSLFTNNITNKFTKTSWIRIAIVGVFIIAAYQLVLFALNLAPVAIISPLRESASVVVTAWGIWKLKERVGLKYKITGVILIFIGIILLAF